MKSKKLISLLIVGLMVAVGLIVYSKSPPKIRAGKLNMGKVIDVVYATGEVKAVRRAEVSAEVPGRVMEVLVEEGDTVKQGELLAILEPALYQASRKMAEQALSRGRSAWEQTREELRRRERLFKQGAVSEAELDSARRKEEQARAELKRLEAALALEEHRAGRVRVESPLSGLVAWRGIDPGEYAATGRTLFRVLAPDSFRAIIQVDESEAGKIKPGQAAILALDAYPGESFKAEVERVVPVISELTKTGEVRLLFKERPRVLHEGMSVTANIITREVERALIAPREAVTLEDDSAWLFKVEPDKTLVKVRFWPGAMDEKQVEIREGPLQEGDLVVLSPSPRLQPGMKVRPVRESSR